MNENPIYNKIPLAVGVSGHRALRKEDLPALRAAVKTQLQQLQADYPNSPLQMLTALAEGADLLCAQIAAELGIPLIVCLPMEASVYTEGFDPESKAAFEQLCALALQVFVVPRTEEAPSEGASAEFLYRQAGLYISRHSHVLLALWDGAAGQSGCGTAEAVQFSLADRRGVLHIATPRGDHVQEPAGTVHKLGDLPFVQDVLAKTEQFNREAGTQQRRPYELLPEDAPKDACTDRLEDLYHEANERSLLAAAGYRKNLAVMSVFSTILTFAFLLYDELNLILLIFVVGAMLIAVWACYRAATRSDRHRCYVEYRALAEWLRVQVYLRYAGSHCQVTDLLTWSQREETAWIEAAVDVLQTGPPAQGSRPIRDCWVTDQKNYHASAKKKSSKQLLRSDRTVQTVLFVSVALYVLMLLFELTIGGSLGKSLLSVADPQFWRTLLRTMLGTVSASTLFVSNYYGKLSLDRVTSDHEKMEHFYAAMETQLDAQGQSEALLEHLAREELIENGNWVSYQRGNAPSMDF